MKTLLGLSLVVAVFFSANLAAQAQNFEATTEHKVLNKDAGVWNAQGKMWMPGAPEPFEFEGVETNQMVGGLWLVTDFRGDFGGLDFHGHGRTGYDIDKKHYVGTWFDSTNPHVMMSTASYDEKTSTMTSKTNHKDPMGNAQNGKATIHYKDADTRIATMFNQDPEDKSKMIKTMQIIYTRKK